MRATVKTMAGSCLMVVLTLVAGCATTYGPTGTNAIVTLGDMVLVPSDTFAMGNCMDPSGGWPDELPIHTVMVSSFYIDKNLVTKQKWDEVYNWATNHGYSFNRPGNGKAPDHPVHEVNWYDCVKWCNAPSEKEGLTPCYYLDASTSVLYRTGESNLWDGSVRWKANGYRLPTEAEWEKAARGELAGCRFPWGNTISHKQANYYSYRSIPCDKNWIRGYHPMFHDSYRSYENKPHTSPVGYFIPNGYGLYDMAGNMRQWCWDWYDRSYYADSQQSDPHGPDTGFFRVLRGSSWSDYAIESRCSYRNRMHYPHDSNDNIGLRCARGRK